MYENRYLSFREIRLPTKTMQIVKLAVAHCVPLYLTTFQERGLYIRWYLAIIISYSTLQARGELLSIENNRLWKATK